MVPGTQGGKSVERKLFDTLHEIATNPDAVKARIDAAETAEAKALEAGTQAVAEQAIAKSLRDSADAQVREADRIRSHADDYAQAVKAEIAKARAKHDAECAAQLAEIVGLRSELSNKLAENDQAATNFKKAIDEHNAAADVARAEALRAGVLSGDLEKAIAVANTREAAARESIAKMRAALSGA